MSKGIYKPLRCRRAAFRQNTWLESLEILTLVLAALVVILSVGVAQGATTKEKYAGHDLFTSPAYCLVIDWTKEPAVAKVTKCKKG
jgi:hypothetical protein